MKKWLEKQFQLSSYGTNVKTELLAGLTTFVTMAYVLATVPSLLGNAGLDRNVMFTAMILLIILTTCAMAFYTNRPFALAPGLVPGGMILAILITTVIGIPFGVTELPSSPFSLPAGIGSQFMNIDFIGALDFAYIPFLIALFIPDFFSTFGTVLGVGAKAGYLDEDGMMSILPDYEPFMYHEMNFPFFIEHLGKDEKDRMLGNLAEIKLSIEDEKTESLGKLDLSLLPDNS